MSILRTWVINWQLWYILLNLELDDEEDDEDDEEDDEDEELEDKSLG